VLDGAPQQWAPHKEQFCDVRCKWVPGDLGGEGVRERFARGPTTAGAEGLNTTRNSKL